MWFTIYEKIHGHLRTGEPRSKSLRGPDSIPEPIEEGDPRLAPRKPIPKKAVYGCFVWQLYAFDLPTLRDLVMANDRLTVTMYTDFLDQESEELIEAARSSDILLLTSGGGAFDVDGFLKLVDISNKMVILVSTFSIEDVRAYIKSRIDFHMPKDFLYDDPDFNRFMKKIIKQLDRQK